MKNWLLQIFTWWSGQTLGTRFFTWRNGVLVGQDHYGNLYYKSRTQHAMLGERRWVIYKGESDPTRLGDGWYGWLQHMRDDAPDGQNSKKEWELPVAPNMTGTDGAYRPKGALSHAGAQNAASADYQAWKP